MDYFYEQLKVGQKYEKIAQHIICQVNNVSVIEASDGTNYKNVMYDFKTSDNITYEVKGDKRSSETNNFFIEFEQSIRKAPFIQSGVTSSDANYWMLLHNETFYVVPFNVLRQQAKQAMSNDNNKKYCKKNPDVTTRGVVIR